MIYILYARMYGLVCGFEGQENAFHLGVRPVKPPMHHRNSRGRLLHHILMHLILKNGHRSHQINRTDDGRDGQRTGPDEPGPVTTGPVGEALPQEDPE